MVLFLLFLYTHLFPIIETHNFGYNGYLLSIFSYYLNIKCLVTSAQFWLTYLPLFQNVHVPIVSVSMCMTSNCEYVVVVLHCKVCFGVCMYVCVREFVCVCVVNSAADHVFQASDEAKQLWQRAVSSQALGPKTKRK